MADLYALSESDVQVLREVIDSTRKGRKNPHLRGKPEPETSQSPEVYVARTPAGGIPDMVGSTPGSAVCNMSRIIAGSLIQLQKTRKVYSLAAVAGDTRVNVQRDKLGVWWALPSGSGGPAPTAFSGVKLSLSPISTQALPNNALVTLTWALGTGYDTATYFDVAHPGRITFTQAGKYRITFKVGFKLVPSPSSTCRTTMQLYKNGGTLLSGDYEDHPAITSTANQVLLTRSVSEVFDLGAGEYAEVLASVSFQSVPGSWKAEGSNGGAVFQAERLG